MRTAHGIRLAAILALGAFALHQLRYLIAFGDSSSAELARQGHGYLAEVPPLIGVFVVSAALATLIRGRYGADLVRASLLRRASILTASLLVIYVAQESLEGILAAGHPAGMAAVLASGGWVALPLAFAIGGLTALVAQALEGFEIAIAARRRRRGLRRAPRMLGRPRAAQALRLALAPLAFGLASRPPPPVPA
jgi:hypothetical protein